MCSNADGEFMLMKPLRLISLAIAALLAIVLTVGATAAAVDQAAPFKAGDLFPAWSPGTLDIHQIVTGRGNSNFMMFPDGTTVLIDAGDQGETEFASQRPDASRTQRNGSRATSATCNNWRTRPRSRGSTSPS